MGNVTRAFVSVGSNIEPEENVQKAVRALSLQTRLLGISTVYLTEPEGRPEQPPYFNCVLEIETSLPPAELKQTVLRRIEDELGRKRGKDKFASRTIDLDLIAYGELVLKTEDLTIPDPEIMRRPFLAVPLYELAPDMKLPGSDVDIKETAAALPRDKMRPLTAYTDKLRREIFHGSEQ
jgi:2-amino-4-hydroxy-6-hydroxymethyldihydropteridine diphosphokinase